MRFLENLSSYTNKELAENGYYRYCPGNEFKISELSTSAIEDNINYIRSRTIDSKYCFLPYLEKELLKRRDSECHVTVSHERESRVTVSYNPKFNSKHLLNSICGISSVKSGKTAALAISSNFWIKKVIFNDPATIVIWEDGNKTVVKCQNGEPYDKEKGLALCIAKRAYGNKSNFNNVFKNYLEEE